MYAYNAKSEPKEYDGVKESEHKSVESIGETVKLKRQKADDKSDDKADEDESANERLDTTDIPNLETEESAEQRRKQKGQGLQILTP